MATVTPINPEPKFNIAATEAEIALIKSALVVMRNVKYFQDQGRILYGMQGQVSKDQQVRAGILAAQLNI